MGSLYLKRYIDRVQDVPAYLKRHMALIRDLDEKVQHLQQEIETNSIKQHVAKKKAQAPGSFDAEPAVTQLLSLADEKVTIAAQVYDFIDKHIQSLDEDLRSLESEIGADKQRLGFREDESASDRIEMTKNRGKGRALASAAGSEGHEKKKRGRKPDTDEDAPSLLQLPVENEPLYCYCQKPSHGEMVACDHDECATEWFHYECVGLTAAPVGEWYCPDCENIMKNKKSK